MSKRHTLAGDSAATFEKANFLLDTARREVANLRGDTSPSDRAKLRQAANKGWIALATGADAYLLTTAKTTTKGRKTALGVYKQLGAEIAAQATTAYDHLHVSCGYEDRDSCTRDSVKLNFRLAGQALAALERSMLIRLSAPKASGMN